MKKSPMKDETQRPGTFVQNLAIKKSISSHTKDLDATFDVT